MSWPDILTTLSLTARASRHLKARHWAAATEPGKETQNRQTGYSKTVKARGEPYAIPSTVIEPI